MFEILAQVAPVTTETSASPEWVASVEHVWSLLTLIVLPILWKHSAKFRAIATVVVQGIEASGDEKTKAAVKGIAERAGLQGKLAPFVEKVTGPDEPGAPKNGA